MGDKSKIDWTDATWNPIVGCSIVSPACTNCYAMAMARRIECMKSGTAYEGTTRLSVNGTPVWTGKVAQAVEHALTQPLRWRRPRKIFVNSMGDLFHESVPDEWIDRVFAVMALAPQHTFQVLTKRSARMRAYLASALRRAAWEIAADPRRDDAFLSHEEYRRLSHFQVSVPTARAYENHCYFRQWPLPNVWIGVTAEDQERADERIPDLLATPAARRFISAEPLLGPLDVRWALGSPIEIGAGFLARGHFAPGLETLRPLDQIITGGESGPNARPSHPDWFRSLRDQCAVSETAYFFKQWGEWAPGEAIDDDMQSKTETGAWFFGGQWRQRPVTVRESETMTFDDEPDVWRVGKRRAGHLLDGREHREFPA